MKIFVPLDSAAKALGADDVADAISREAKARGLDTCPQAAWNHFHSIVLDVLGTGDDEELVCGMSLGYADPDHILNTFITPRVPVEEFAVFVDE